MNKHALVVGINQYQDAGNINPVRYAEQDAGRVGTFLQRCGFTVSELKGPAAGRKAIGQAIEQLCAGLAPGDLFVCYFAGHGYEDREGHALLLPVDVRMQELQQGALESTLPLRDAERATATCGAARVFLLDVCRAPLAPGRQEIELSAPAARGVRALSQSAASPLAIVYSCSEHQRTCEIDDPDVGGGPFACALLQILNSRLAAGREFVLPAELEEVADSCRRILEQYMPESRQDPWCAANRDRIAVLEPAWAFRPEEMETAQLERKGERPTKRDEAVTLPAGGERHRGAAVADWRHNLPLYKALHPRPENGELRRTVEAASEAQEESRRQEAQRRAQLPRPGRRWVLGAVLMLGVVLVAWLGTRTGGPLRPSAKPGEAVHPGAVATPVRLGNISLEFVSIPPGDFVMGCSTGDENCFADEEPAHPVRITKPFEIGKYEVTQAQWQAVMGSNPSHFKGPDRPVENVRWTEVEQFLKQLNDRGDGYRYRLPLETEWEYAARAGTTAARLGSLDVFGWYDANSGGETHPVGQKQPNAWGLHDVHGNVWEWVADEYRNYGVGKQSKGRALPSTESSSPASGTGRVVRGGSWGTLTYEVRLSVRFTFTPENRSNNIGLRCVRERIQ